jgi:tape measure domain-containing protein
MNVAMLAVGYTALRMGESLRKSIDTITNLKNQTNVFAKSQEGANFRMESAIKIARKWNQPLSQIGDVMQRVSIAQDAAGIGDETVVKVVENLTAAVALSGATAQEAEGALRQFAQGMAANRLSGQELNSVLEQTPLVASILADSMTEMGKWGKVAIGSLRRLGEAGEITTKVLVDTFGKELPKLEELFKKYNFPIDALLKSLKNEWDLFLDEFGQTSGLTENFKDMLKDMKLWAVGINTALADGTLELAGYVNAAYGWIKALVAFKVASMSFALVSATFTGMAVAVGAVSVAMNALKWASIKASLATASAWIVANAPFIAVAASIGAIILLLSNMGVSWQGMKDVAASAISSIVNGAKWAHAAWKTFADAMSGGMARGADGALSMKETFDRNLKSLGTYTADDVKATMSGVTDGIMDSITSGFDKGSAYAKEKLAELAMSGGQFFTDLLPGGSMGSTLGGGAGVASPDAAPDKANELLTLTAKQMTAYDRLTAKLNPLVAATREYQDAIALLQAHFLSDGTAEGWESYVANLALVEEQLGKVTTQLEGINELGGPDSFLGSFGQAMADNFDMAGGAAKAFGQIAGDAFNGALDGLVEFTTTGKMDIKSFGLSIIKELQKIILKLMIVKMLQAAAGLGGGGAGSIGGFAKSLGKSMGADVSEWGRATGGPVASGKAYMVGEKGPELFVPPSGGSIKNATATAGMAPVVNTTVVNVQDPADIPAAMATAAGEEVILNIMQNNPEILREIS